MLLQAPFEKIARFIFIGYLNIISSFKTKISLVAVNNKL